MYKKKNTSIFRFAYQISQLNALKNCRRPNAVPADRRSNLLHAARQWVGLREHDAHGRRFSNGPEPTELENGILTAVSRMRLPTATSIDDRRATIIFLTVPRC
jgi:hypothetical protein